MIGNLRGLRCDWFCLVLLAVPPLLIMPNLGDMMLWQDEAETALLGRCTLAHGYPLALDGTRVITDQLGKDLDKNGVWIWSPWLQCYAAAASFALFGESAWSARLPFALFGWATIVLSYAAIRDATGDRRLARLASLLLMTSVPFLLQVRQCRYYSLLSFFAMLHWWGYVRLAHGKQHGAWMFAGGAIGVFHAFFPHLALSLAAMTGHWLTTARRSGGRARRFVVPLVAIAIATVPFALYVHAWSRNYDDSGYGSDSPLRYAATLRAYLFLVHKYCWPFLWALPFALTHGRRWRWWHGIAFTLAAAAVLGMPASTTSLALVMSTSAMVSLALISIWRQAHDPPFWRSLIRWQMVVLLALLPALAPFPFFRYLDGMLPLFALLTAALVLDVCSRLARARAALVVIVVIVATMIGSDFFGHAPLLVATEAMAAAQLVPPDASAGHAVANGVAEAVVTHVVDGRRFHVPPLDYAFELTHHYVGPVGAVIEYLRANAQRSDVVVATYEHFPLMFATQLEIVQNDAAREQDLLPEWFFFHGNRAQTLGRRVSLALDTRRYRMVDIDAIEFPWENVPEPYWHQFRTLRMGPRVRLGQRR